MMNVYSSSPLLLVSHKDCIPEFVAFLDSSLIFSLLVWNDYQTDKRYGRTFVLI